MSTNVKRNALLVNATQTEVTRLALVEGDRICELDYEFQGKERKKADIHKAVITRIEPSLEAVFVDYGATRHGFLPFREISPDYFKDKNFNLIEDKAKVRDQLKEGQEIVIQVEKEQRGNKGAALTTYISLAGCYIVLMPNNPKAGGISRRIDGDDRAELKDVIDQLNYPKDMGIIVRTAGVGRNIDELQWDVDFLLRQWDSIKSATKNRRAPFLVYKDSSILLRAVRDYLRKNITEIVVDSPNAYDVLKNYVQMMRPDYIDLIRLYNDSIPLFNRYQIETQIEEAFLREVPLPSGGAIVIDHTEALISIDVNSAKATKGSHIEETALQTNLEAAETIARQLRLRDNGGLVVIDFIDMVESKNQRAVENQLKESLKNDRARVQVGRISQFGLLEMSRQRTRPSLSSVQEITCPQCSGQGSIRTVEVLAINVIRLIEDEAIKPDTAHVVADLPINIATFVVNEKRATISQIERRHDVKVLVLPNRELFMPHYEIRRVKKSELPEDKVNPSYKFEKTQNQENLEQYIPSSKTAQSERPKADYAAVRLEHTQAPTQNEKETTKTAGLFKRLFASIVGSKEEKTEKKEHKKQNYRKRRNNQRDKTRRGRRGNHHHNNKQETNNVNTPSDEEKTNNAKPRGSNQNRRRKKNPRNNNPNHNNKQNSKKDDRQIKVEIDQD